MTTFNHFNSIAAEGLSFIGMIFHNEKRNYSEQL